MTLYQSFTGVFAASLATSFVFGVLHGTLTQYFIVFADIMFCFIFEETGNIWMCVFNAQLI